jgi:hypothetical protein
MKKYLFICGLVLGLLFFLSPTASAQSGSSAGSGTSTWLPSVQNGTVSPALALLIIYQATPYFQGLTGLGYWQLVQRYYAGQLTITVIPADPVNGDPLSFRVAYGGGIAIISITDVL